MNNSMDVDVKRKKMLRKYGWIKETAIKASHLMILKSRPKRKRKRKKKHQSA